MKKSTVSAHSRSVKGKGNTRVRRHSRVSKTDVHKKINTRGIYEQEKGIRFPGLYPEKAKAVSKSVRGMYKREDRKIRKRNRL